MAEKLVFGIGRLAAGLGMGLALAASTGLARMTSQSSAPSPTPNPAPSSVATPPGPIAGPAPVTTPAPSPPTAAEAAPVALLVDLTSGRTLYARAPDQPFLPASVTKTMTAFLAFDLMAQGKLRADQRITVSDSVWRDWHATGSRMFLNRGEAITVDQLLAGIMTVSANDGAATLAEGAAGSIARWVAMMNDEARRLGMTGSHFGTPNGWMDNGNTHVTARDLVTLADAMIRRFPQYYHRYIGLPAMRWNGIEQRNHNPVLDLPGVDGIKTGWTNEAHYTFLGSAARDGQRLVLVLAGVPTPAARARAARALIEWGFAAWQTRPLFAAGARLASAQVQNGAATAVPLVTPRTYAVTTPRGVDAPARLRVIYDGPLIAPIAKGATIATLEVRVGEDPPTRLPLVAGASVAGGGLIDRLRSGFARMLAG